MDKTFSNVLISSLFVIGCLALNASAKADEDVFTLKSSATGKCLHLQGADQPNGSEIRVLDPCQATPDFRVENTKGMMGGGRGGPGTSTMVLELYIFSALIKTSLPGIASAVSVLLFLVSLLLIVPLFAVRRQANEEAAAS